MKDQTKRDVSRWNPVPQPSAVLFIQTQIILQVTSVMRERTALNDTINSLKDQLAAASSSQEATQAGSSSSLAKLQEDFKNLSMQAEGGLLVRASCWKEGSGYSPSPPSTNKALFLGARSAASCPPDASKESRKQYEEMEKTLNEHRGMLNQARRDAATHQQALKDTEAQSVSCALICASPPSRCTAHAAASSQGFHGGQAAGIGAVPAAPEADASK
eukprot:1147241-Pelagomonas_calceolata.AAC.2